MEGNKTYSEVREFEENDSMILVAILIIMIFVIGIVLALVAFKYGVPKICKDAWDIILLLFIFYFASVIRNSLLGRYF